MGTGGTGTARSGWWPIVRRSSRVDVDPPATRDLAARSHAGDVEVAAALGAEVVGLEVALVGAGAVAAEAGLGVGAAGAVVGAFVGVALGVGDELGDELGGPLGDELSGGLRAADGVGAGVVAGMPVTTTVVSVRAAQPAGVVVRVTVTEPPVTAVRPRRASGTEPVAGRAGTLVSACASGAPPLDARASAWIETLPVAVALAAV
jgi:hypothetical protein